MVNRKAGFTLIELAIVLAVSAILASAVVPFYIKQAQIRAGEKTALEVAVIQEAARAYYIDNDSWPTDINTLKSGGYLNNTWVTNNPWNNSYLISSTPLTFTVSTDVPAEWASLVARDLPSTTISSGTVNSSIPIPGAASSSDPLPSGSIILWEGPSCPDGFSRVSELDGKFLVGGSSYVVNAGGSNTHDHAGWTGYHTLTIAEIPPHTHSEQGHFNYGCRGGDDNVGAMRTRRTGPTGGGQPHRHSIAPADNRPEFATVLLCRKD